MKFLKPTFFTVVFGLMLSVATAGVLPSDIKSAIKNGDAPKVAAYFNDTVELSIAGNKSVYSKTQATQVLSNFFKQNPPSSFIEKHSGGSKESGYVIGILTSGTNKFRVTILYKGSQPQISQFTIEKDSGF